MLAVRAGLSAFFRTRSGLALEILALGQQETVLKGKRPRPRTEFVRPAVLRTTAAILVWLAERADRGQTRHRGRLVPGRISLVLAFGSLAGAEDDFESQQKPES
jgi:hypothetical protein